jgi:putative transposase
MQKTNGIYYKNRHSCFLLQYHLVLVMKYRRKALVGEVRECVYKTLRDGLENQGVPRSPYERGGGPCPHPV